MSDDVLVLSRKGRLAELWDSTAWRVGLFLAASVALGMTAGLLWSWLAPLPAYTVNDDMTAVIKPLERWAGVEVRGAAAKGK